MGKQARTGRFTDAPFYECIFAWPENCFVQGGDGGVVFTECKLEKTLMDPVDAVTTIVTGEGKHKHYRTSFFEAFPKIPDTFIRGEGATIEEAEAKAWQQYQHFLSCKGPNGHEFEARGYRNGAGFCKHCGMFGSDTIPPIHPCKVCGVLTWYHEDTEGGFWCKEHVHLIPEELQSDLDKSFREHARQLEEDLIEHGWSFQADEEEEARTITRLQSDFGGEWYAHHTYEEQGKRVVNFRRRAPAEEEEKGE